MPGGATCGGWNLKPNSRIQHSTFILQQLLGPNSFLMGVIEWGRVVFAFNRHGRQKVELRFAGGFCVVSCGLNA